MANLLWKKINTTTKLLSTPFKSEDEFERFVFETPEILEEIYLIKRQVKTGSKTGIPDIIGIDNDGSICIVEMKNKKVDHTILPQILQYALWADQNPDSIKALWLEAKDRPDDLELSWEDIHVRIIIIAPKILPSTLQFIDKISYDVDLVEVNRWIEKNNHFILVDKLEPEVQLVKARTTKGLENYDEAFYNTYHNKESVKWFFKYVNEIEKIIIQKRWSLEKKYNKYYCGFKAGFFTAFRVQWIGSKTLALILHNVNNTEANKFKPKITRYDKKNRPVYYIEMGKTKVTDFVQLFEIAFRRLSGE